MKQQLISVEIFALIILTSSVQLFSMDFRSNWQWATKIESPSVGLHGLTTTTDTYGNTYVAGESSDEVFLGNITIQSLGNGNLFLAKLNSNGTWMWARCLRGSSDYSMWDCVEQIVAVGNEIYMLGYTCFPITIDNVTITSNSAYSSGGGPFLAKFNSSGVCTMGVALDPSVAPSTHYVFFKHMVITNSAIYLANTWTAPSTTTPIQFGSISVMGYNDGDTTDSDVIYAKLNLQGTFQWVRSIGGASDETLSSICSDTDGNLFLGGEFAANMVAGSVQLSSVGFNDVYIIKTDTNGNVLWGRRGGSIRDDTIASLDYNNGKIFGTGTYPRQCDFGQYILQPYNDNVTNLNNGFVFSIDTSGNWTSANRFGGENMSVYGLSQLIYDENVYVVLPGIRYIWLGDDIYWSLGQSYTMFAKVIAGLDPLSNTWFGVAYATSTGLGYVYDSISSDTQYLYLGFECHDQVNFGNILITPTMTSCYVIGKISKSEVVENEDDLNVLTNNLDMSIYPNPFRTNCEQVISYKCATGTIRSIEIYNVKGQRIKSYRDLMQSGTLKWNGYSDNLLPVASGIYYYKLNSGKESIVKKAILY